MVSASSVEASVVERMICRLEHRGPDESGIWSGPGCVLGHQRLSIIDLSPTGSQPMADERGRLVVAFNGEIFNFRRLREELVAMGLAFRGTSDTEVLLHGFRAWGDALPEKLLGMFAVAVWDSERKRLVMVRDRYGKKPLFYTQEKGRLIFASELEALLGGMERQPSVSPQGFASYARFGYVPGVETTYAGIQRLAPGHILVWEGGRTTVRAYHEWPPPGDQSSLRAADEGKVLDELHGILRSAVADRLVSDVPLGCFLSGGIDSSLIVALARELAGSGLKTFNVSFPGTDRDEGDQAAMVAKALQTDHHRLELSMADMESAYLETLRMATEPIGDDSYIPTCFISRVTREHVTVALSGDGGDELFGGYPKYRQIEWAARFHPWSRAWPRCLDALLPDKASKAMQLFRGSNPSSRALWLGSLWKEKELERLLIDPSAAEGGRLLFEREWEKCAAGCLQNQFSLTDIATYLEGDILTKVDRASMSVSLEVRSPLLDERVLDFTCRVGLRCTPLGREKGALRRLLARYLNPRFFDGPKKGFGLPIDQWLRGGLRPVLEEYTSAERLRAGGLIDPGYITKVRDAHLSGRRNYGRKLHALIAWEVWREKVSGPAH